MNLGGVGLNQNRFDEIKVFNNSINNLTICKELYANLYANVGSSFHDYLQHIPEQHLSKTEENLRINIYSFVYVQNQYHTKEVMNTFDRFFDMFGRFPAEKELATIPTGNVPNFVKQERNNFTIKSL